jgi:hypothetical protein
MTDFPDLQVKDPETMIHLEKQLNRFTTEIAHTDFSNNRQACTEFFELMMDFKESNRQHFSHETIQRVGNQLSKFINHRDNQIAQGIVEALRQEGRDRNPEDERVLTRWCLVGDMQSISTRLARMLLSYCAGRFRQSTRMTSISPHPGCQRDIADS